VMLLLGQVLGYSTGLRVQQHLSRALRAHVVHVAYAARLLEWGLRVL
jgi:hypothetical protein